LEPWPFFGKSFVNIGSDIEVYGYLYEPLGSNELQFRERYLKGHILGISRESNYPDSFELNFPILFGMSGSPLLRHLPLEGTNKIQTGVVGCVYGSRESEVVHHKVVSTEDYEERVSKIVELGLAYMQEAIFSIFENTDIEIKIYDNRGS
jgi:hypothetical protein